MAEWLRRVPAKYMGFPRESSNLSGDDIFFRNSQTETSKGPVLATVRSDLGRLMEVRYCPDQLGLAPNHPFWQTARGN